MPEGPEAKIVAESLHAHIAGKSIVGFHIPEPLRFINGLENIPFPMKVMSIVANTKKVIFTLENKGMIVSSLGMTGRWSYEEQKWTRLKLLIGTIRKDIVDKHGNPIIATIIDEIVYYSDMSMKGMDLAYYIATDVPKYMKTLGPDILSTTVSESVWSGIFSDRKVLEWEVCKLLVDPHKIGGIGNYLRAEILYYCKISPKRKVKDLSREEIELLRQWSHYIIRESYKAGGLTIKDFWSPEGKRGSFKNVVYNQSHDPHGNKVEKYKRIRSERNCSWVPAVQC